MLPNLKALMQKEQQRKEKLADSTNALGVQQAFELGERSNLEYVHNSISIRYRRTEIKPHPPRRVRLSEMEEQITKLAAMIEVTLGRPPDSERH